MVRRSRLEKLFWQTLRRQRSSQVGNSGFTATSQSGDAKLGEPGAAGFGTIRAGATERSNVDLTADWLH